MVQVAGEDRPRTVDAARCVCLLQQLRQLQRRTGRLGHLRIQPRVEVAQGAEPAIAHAAGRAQADGKFRQRGRPLQRDRAGRTIDLREAQVIAIRVLEQPRRGEHRRHVVAGFLRQLVVDARVVEAHRGVVADRAAHASLAAVVGAEGEFEVVVEDPQLLVDVLGVRPRRCRGIEAQVKTAVAAQPETHAGGVHELQRA